MKKIAYVVAVLVIAFAVAAFGLWIIGQGMYVESDAQGGLAFAAAPLWQWAGLLLFTIPVVLLNRGEDADGG